MEYKTREEIKGVLYEIAEDLKNIGDKYANGEYKDTKDFAPIALKFQSIVNYLLNPHLEPKDIEF